jgi:integrase
MPRRRRDNYRFLDILKGRDGLPMYYFRRDRGSERIRLHGKPGSQEFDADYYALMAGGAVQPVKRKDGKSIRHVFELYRNSADWAALSDMTRRVRGCVLRNIEDQVGDEPISLMARSTIQARLDARRDKPDQANFMLTTLNQMFKWAVKADLVDKNPCEGLNYLKRPKVRGVESGHKTWSELQLDQFERHYPHGTWQRLAYSALLYTGLRIGDVAILGPEHIQQDGTIFIRTEKTGAEVTLPILPPLQEALDRAPENEDGGAFVTGPRGVSVGKEHLGAIFNQAVRDAGLEGLTAHGLRKAGARRLAEAGYSTKQLMAVFGWGRSEMADKYTAKAERRGLALEAAKGLMRGKKENVFVLTPQKRQGKGQETPEVSAA